MPTFRVVAGLLAATVLTSLGATATAARATDASCGPSAGYTVCLDAPPDPLVGEVAISATASGSTAHISSLNFYWGATLLLVDTEAPYGFVWPTTKYLDGAGTLSVKVVTSSVVGAAVGRSATLQNGNISSIQQNPSDWKSLFAPRDVPVNREPVIAAVGDGADGTTDDDGVVAAIANESPTAVLYLGDVYERGTYPEMRDHYGLAAFDDPAGTGTHWGALAGYTLPTLGNHEAHNVAAWQDYWHQRPLYTANDVGGVHVVNLESECSQPALGGCAEGSAQYNWLQADLANNTKPCVVAFFHRPRVSAIQQTLQLAPIWALLARNGGDLVLNGHIHDMEQSLPLNADVQANASDSHMVELISGAGGHNESTAPASDSRIPWRVRNVNGAAYVTAVGGSTGVATRLNWTFRDVAGQPVMDANGVAGTGSVDCAAAPIDATSPTQPGKPSGSGTSPGAIDLTWDGSVDLDSPTLTYQVFRDDGTTPIDRVTTDQPTVTYRDTGLAGGSTHTYRVRASDGSGNESPDSDASDPITVVGPVLSDNFDHGLGAWQLFNVSLDSGAGNQAPPSAKLVANRSGAYAYRSLASPYRSLCMSEAVQLATGNAATVIMRLKTAGNAGIARAYIGADRVLRVRSDVTGKTFSTTRPVDSTWNTVQLCVDVASTGRIQVSLNGNQVGSWSTMTGTTEIGRVQFGDSELKTFTLNVDDVVVS